MNLTCKDRPLTLPLSPSEGERENRRPITERTEVLGFKARKSCVRGILSPSDGERVGVRGRRLDF